MAKVLFFLLFFSASLFAQSDLAREAKKLLPREIQELTLKKTSSNEAEKILGKPHLVEGSKHYWEVKGFKYGLELSFDKNKKLQSIHYTFTGEKPPLTKLPKFDSEKLTPLSSTLMKLKDNGCEVVIDVPKKTISSVRFP